MTKKRTKKTKVKQTYDGAGRPTIKTDDIVLKLEEALKSDFTISEACNYAGISRPSYYKWLQEDEVFSYRMEKAQQYLAFKAKKTVAKGVEKEDMDSSKWWLTRRQRDRYATKVENELSKPEPLTADEEEEIDESLKNAGLI